MAAPAGFISVRRQFIMSLLESQNEEQIRSLAKNLTLSSNKNFLLMLRKKLDILSALDLIETWIRISGYAYNHSVKDLDYSSRLHSFIIQHHMGMKWSLYLAELYKNLFEEFGRVDAQFDINDSTLAFELVVPIKEVQVDHIHSNIGLDCR